MAQKSGMGEFCGFLALSRLGIATMLRGYPTGTLLLEYGGFGTS
jgi:hypothetical protein